jgi:hypothetical protein
VLSVEVPDASRLSTLCRGDRHGADASSASALRASTLQKRSVQNTDFEALDMTRGSLSTAFGKCREQARRSS